METLEHNTFKAFKKIGQFRDVIKGARLKAQYVGRDENDNAIYNEEAQLPTLTFTGTVKLHGTNAGISYNRTTDILTPQKRSSVIGGMHGHYGFVEWVKTHEDYLKGVMKEACLKAGVDFLYLFGEWVGQGVQKKVAISELSKRFVVFEAWNPVTEEYTNPEIISHIHQPEQNCYNIRHYKTYTVTVDLRYPELAIENINKIIDEVECCCPVAKAMLTSEDPEKHKDRVEYLGEGVVFKCGVNWFKAKGEKHSKGGAKRPQVNVEKVANIKKFVELVVTEDRLQQCWDTIQGDVGEIDKKHIGNLLRWMFNDIITEEGDTMSENNLDKKDVGGAVSNIARPWFLNKINSTF